MNQIEQLFVVVDAYRAARGGLSESRVSTLVFNDGKRLARVREGADIGSRMLARSVQWFSDNWPAEAAWPEGIERPAFSTAETTEPQDDAA